MIADKYELEKYLAENPWPLDFSQERPVEYIYMYHTDVPREAV